MMRRKRISDFRISDPPSPFKRLLNSGISVSLYSGVKELSGYGSGKADFRIHRAFLSGYKLNGRKMSRHFPKAADMRRSVACSARPGSLFLTDIDRCLHLPGHFRYAPEWRITNVYFFRTC